MGVVINPKMDAILTTLGKIKDDIKGLGFAAKGSGNIVSFPDSIGGFNVNRITADLAPVQLGSGDPSPTNIRPIIGHTEVETTGTGKNLCNTSKLQYGEVGNYINSTIRIHTLSDFIVHAGETYSFSMNFTTSGDIRFVWVTAHDPITLARSRYILNRVAANSTFTTTNEDEGKILGITFGIGDANPPAVWRPISINDVISWKPQLEKGNTVTTYEPFGASVLTEIGINQWDEEWRVGAYDSSGNYVTGYNYVANATPIKVTPSATYSCNKRIWRWEYDANGTYLGISANNGSDGGSFTVSANTHYINFRTYDNQTSYANNISINYPARFTDYYPYTGIGAVYGGTLDVTSGKLTATYGIVDLGSLEWSVVSPSTYKSGVISDIKPNESSRTLANAICEAYKQYNYYDLQNFDAGFCVIWTSSAVVKTVYIRNVAYSTPSDLKASLAGVHLVYELETPIVYQLEPQAVQTVLGQNNIYTDSGEVNVWYVAGLS